MDSRSPSPPDDLMRQIAFPEEYPMLPTNISLHYLAEGAANVIYRIKLPSSALTFDEVSSSHAAAKKYYNVNFWKDKLLRLRKDLPHLSKCVEAHEETKTAIWTYFEKKDLVDQNLVVLHSDVVRRLNEKLMSWETEPHPENGTLRPNKRKGTYLADDCHGLLVEDMTPGPRITLIEFKPKWLVQCPAAPSFSKRCRTCAKRARENYLLELEWKLGQPFYCPLDLMARDDDTALRRAARAIFVNQRVNSSLNVKTLVPGDEVIIGRIASWAKLSNLLWNLRNLQKALGSKSVFDSDYEGELYRAAMTFRDCTIYLKIPDDKNSDVTAKIGDLELKSAKKVGYWKQMERCLKSEGWYEGTEEVEAMYTQPLTCNLFPEEWTSLPLKEMMQVKL